MSFLSGFIQGAADKYSEIETENRASKRKMMEERMADIRAATKEAKARDEAVAKNLRLAERISKNMHGGDPRVTQAIADDLNAGYSVDYITQRSSTYTFTPSTDGFTPPAQAGTQAPSSVPKEYKPATPPGLGADADSVGASATSGAQADASAPSGAPAPTGANAPTGAPAPSGAQANAPMWSPKPVDPATLSTEALVARAASVDPESPEGKALLTQITRRRALDASSKPKQPESTGQLRTRYALVKDDPNVPPEEVERAKVAYESALALEAEASGLNLVGEGMSAAFTRAADAHAEIQRKAVEYDATKRAAEDLVTIMNRSPDVFKLGGSVAAGLFGTAADVDSVIALAKRPDNTMISPDEFSSMVESGAGDNLLRSLFGANYDRNAQLAQDQKLALTTQYAMAYRLASAEGSTGASLSDSEFRGSLGRVTANSSNPETIVKNLNMELNRTRGTILNFSSQFGSNAAFNLLLRANPGKEDTVRGIFQMPTLDEPALAYTGPAVEAVRVPENTPPQPGIAPSPAPESAAQAAPAPAAQPAPLPGSHPVVVDDAFIEAARAGGASEDIIRQLEGMKGKPTTKEDLKRVMGVQ